MDSITWAHRTLIIPAAIVEQARALGARFGPAADGMWTTPLSPTGREPATHYISAGLIDEAFATMLASPEVLHAAAQAIGYPLPESDCEALLAAADVSEDKPFDAIRRLGLQLVVPKDDVDEAGEPSDPAEPLPSLHPLTP